MEVELDVDAPRQSWRQVATEWAACCRETWLCREEKLFKDDPMAPADWDKHMSWRRFCVEPRILVRVVRMLSVVEAWVLLVSTAAALYATLLQPKPGWPQACSKDYMVVFQLTSFALALLMVFRTNTAHARWWEARTAVGRWLNVVRNTQRMLLSWAQPGEAGLVREFARWNAALTSAAAAYLCRKDCYWQHCADLLTPAELQWLRTCDNPPVKVMMVMSGLLRRSSLAVMERTAVENELTFFDVALGACERITRQAIPMAYTRHTSRFIIVYLTFLPFAMWPYLKWLTIPTMVVLAFLLVGIENIGVQIENPVRVLPMHRFCVGNKTAALSMVRHFYAVQHAIETGLAAAKVEGLDGQPEDARLDPTQHRGGQLHTNGHAQRPEAGAGTVIAAPPMPPMSRA